MKVGKHLFESKSKCKKLNGISVEEYLEKERTIFKNMDARWDLDELEKVPLWH
jgi:hypothetical protein